MEQKMLFVMLHAHVNIHCWRWASVAFCFHVDQMLQFKLWFHIHDYRFIIDSRNDCAWQNIKCTSNFAIGSSLFGSTYWFRCANHVFEQRWYPNARAQAHTGVLEKWRDARTWPALQSDSSGDGHCGDEVLFKSRATGRPYSPVLTRLLAMNRYRL